MSCRFCSYRYIFRHFTLPHWKLFEKYVKRALCTISETIFGDLFWHWQCVDFSFCNSICDLMEFSNVGQIEVWECEMYFDGMCIMEMDVHTEHSMILLIHYLTAIQRKRLSNEFGFRQMKTNRNEPFLAMEKTMRNSLYPWRSNILGTKDTHK